MRRNIGKAALAAAIGDEHGAIGVDRDTVISQVDGLEGVILLTATAALGFDRQFYSSGAEMGLGSSQRQRSEQVALERLYQRYASKHAVGVDEGVVEITTGPGRGLQYLQVAAETDGLVDRQAFAPLHVHLGQRRRQLAGNAGFTFLQIGLEVIAENNIFPDQAVGEYFVMPETGPNFVERLLIKRIVLE